MADPLDFTAAIENADRARDGLKSTARGNIRPTNGVIPIFHTRETLDKRATEAAGRPVYRLEDWLEVIIPGSRDRPVAPVKAEDKLTYAEAWESYKAGDAREIAGGVPITEWQAITRTRAAELRALGFYTVELVAAASDTQRQKIGADGRALVDMAKAFLENHSEIERERKLRAEIESKFAEAVAALTETQARVAELERKLSGADDDVHGATDGASRRARGRA